MAHILIVDDEEPIRSFIADALTLEGHHVAMATDGLKALSILSKQPVDLVITDIFMPDMDGLELIKKIHIASSKIAIIAMSGKPAQYSKPYLGAASQFGAALVIPKPLDIDELTNAVDTVLKNSITMP